MTALVTGWPRYSSAACFNFCRIIAEISGGGYSLPPAFTRTSPLPAPRHRVRHHLHLLGDFVELAAHEALDREHGVLGVGHRLALRDLADQALARLGEAHHRRGDAAAFRIRNDDRLAAFHDRHDGVGRPEIDSDDLAHVLSSSRVQPLSVRSAGGSIFITLVIYNLSALMSTRGRLIRRKSVLYWALPALRPSTKAQSSLRFSKGRFSTRGLLCPAWLSSAAILLVVYLCSGSGARPGCRGRVSGAHLGRRRRGAPRA